MMARTALNALAVTVLNLLDERPMHPYEMQQTIRERHLDEVLNLNSGSLYHAVDRMAAAQLIAPQETQREGRRPERTVYAITERGRDEFLAWLRERIAEPEREYPRFAAALAFMAHLLPIEASALLQHRCMRLEGAIAAGDILLRGARQHGLPRLYVLENEYGQVLRRAELEWLQALVTVITDSSLDGMPEWLAAHGRQPAALGASDGQEGSAAMV